MKTLLIILLQLNTVYATEFNTESLTKEFECKYTYLTYSEVLDTVKDNASPRELSDSEAAEQARSYINRNCRQGQ